MSRLVSTFLMGTILMTLSACGSDSPAPDPVIRDLATAKTARVQLMYESKPVEWTISDPGKIGELAGMLKTDGDISKPQERPGTNDVIHISISEATSERLLFDLVDGNRFMYGPKREFMVKLKDREFYRSLMADAERRLNLTPK